MNSKIKAAVASLLAVSVIMPTVASCGKKGGGNGVITEDTPWYNITTVELDSDIDKNAYDYYEVKYIGAKDGNYIFEASGMLKLGGVDYTTIDVTDYQTNELQIVDSNGNKTATIDLQSAVNDADLADIALVRGVNQIGDRIRVLAETYNADYSTSAQYAAYIDVAAGTVGEFTPIENPFAEEMLALNAYMETALFVGDYMIEPFWISDDTLSSYVLSICDTENNYSKIDLREVLPDTDIYTISDAFDIGNNTALLMVGSRDGRDLPLTIDLSNMTASASSTDYSWLQLGYDTHSAEIAGYGRVLSNSTGISVVNFDTQSLDPIMEYCNCNINLSDVRTLTPIDMTDGRIVLTGSMFRVHYGTYDNDNVLIFLDRAETNPNVGKQILTLASITEPSYALCEAICEYNETNPDYYIQLDNRYSLVDYMNESDSGEEDENVLQDRASASLGSQLSVDLMGGVGPDMIFDAYTFGQLDNPDYLVDLNDFVQTNLSGDSYYGNIIESGYTGDAIYQLPVTFGVEGISTNASNASGDQVGFTFDDYGTFVSTACNGTDPMNLGKIEFFVTALNGMMDLMVDADGNFNFDNEAFRALAQYTHDEVLEKIDTGDEYSSYDADAAASVVRIGSISSYFERVGSENVLLGYPSFDGRGPIVTARDSIGVSAQSSGIDGCMQFLSQIFSKESQVQFSALNGIPVSREAFFETADSYIEGHNATVESLRSYMSDAELRSMGYIEIPADSDITNEFNTLLSGLQGGSSASDGAVNTIIREELPAYFEDQKSLDEVIRVLQDRAQTVVNERR